MLIPISLETCTAPRVRFVIPDDGGTLGRSPRCTFVVNDTTISRKHAELRVCDSELLVTDLGSRNGTFFDDQRIQECRIVVGKVIQFGRVAFKMSLADLQDETDSCESELSEIGSVLLATQLTVAQRRVFELVVSGLADKAIARRLALSPHTVHNHMRAIFAIFQVHSRAQLLALQLRTKG